MPFATDVAIPDELGCPNLRLAHSRLETPNVLDQVLVPDHPSLAPLRTEGAFPYSRAHAEFGIFALCYVSASSSLTLLFDPWSTTTREHLQHAAANDGIAINLLGSEGQAPFKPTFGWRQGDPFWSDALRQIDEYRATHAPRNPWDYLCALAEPRVLRLHAAWPARSIRGDATPATTVVLLMDQTHAADAVERCGH